MSATVPMSVEPGSEGVARISLSSKRNASDAALNEPETFVFVYKK